MTLQTHPHEPPPAPLARSKFDHWCWLRGLRLQDIAQAVGCLPERARRFRLPFGDPLRVIPNEEEMGRIVAWTGGDVGPADFYPPQITAPEGAAQQDRWAG